MVTRNMNYYLNYWDNVIRRWFEGDIESNQELLLNDISLNLNVEHMPEPYWGDPEKCSIVIANYNPGGGTNRSRHTYKACACCPESFINQVKKYGYQAIAKSFPIIDDPQSNYNPLKENYCWWKEYEGRRWWIRRVQWLNDIIINGLSDSIDSISNKPFAFEFCVWHSVNWQNKACLHIYNKINMVAFVENYFVKVLVDTVHNSDTHLGICIGSQFFHLFNKIGEKDKGIKLIDTEVYGKESPYQIHFYNIHGEIVLVIWGKGRNRYPSVKKEELSFLFKKYL